MKKYFTDEHDEEAGPDAAPEKDERRSAEAEDDRDPLVRRAEKNKVYYLFYRVSTHSVFSTIIILMILSNTIILALDRYPIDADELIALETANEVLSWCFFAEMIIKVCARVNDLS